MVGVPSSKGCALCLQRSVKCDEARPSCSQCKRGGRKCPGYKRALKFVDEGSKIRHRTAPISKTRHPSKRAIAASNSLISIINHTSPVGKLKTKTLDETDWRYEDNGGVSSSLYEIQPSTQERTQLLACFISDMFPLGIASVQRSYLGSWLWHLPPRLGGSAVLDYAAMSLALAYFSRVSADQTAFQNAEVCYNIALRVLASAIADEKKQYSADVLCATMLLGNYESFFNRNHSWIRHAGGAVRLMQIRGARRCYESAFEYSMFLACRGTIITEALISGSFCFLDTEAWRAIPGGLIEFPLLPNAPELHHAFFGHLAAVPGIVNRVKSLDKDAPKGQRLSLLSKAETIRRDFILWHDKYTTSDDGIRKPTLVKGSPSPGTDAAADCFYNYYDVASATIITTYYAYRIVLNGEMNRLLADDSYNSENTELAQDILKSVRYLWESGYCGISTLKIIFPIANMVVTGKYHGWDESWKERSDDLESPTIQESY